MGQVERNETSRTGRAIRTAQGMASALVILGLIAASAPAATAAPVPPPVRSAEPARRLLEAVASHMQDPDFDSLGAALAGAGMTRQWWDEHVDVRLYRPAALNLPGWDFDLLMFLQLEGIREGVICAFALPDVDPAGPPAMAAVSVDQLTRCSEASAKEVASPLPGTVLILDNAGLMDALWPLDLSLPSAVDTGIDPIGLRSYTCSDLRWNSTGSREAGARAAAVAGGASAEAISTTLIGLTDRWLASGDLVPLQDLTGGLVPGALLVGAAVGGAWTGRAAHAEITQGCAGCADRAGRGEVCEVRGDECMCGPQAPWMASDDSSS